MHKNKTILISIIAFVVVLVIGVISLAISSVQDRDQGNDVTLVDSSTDNSSGKTLQELLKSVEWDTSELVKAPISMGDTTLYDELPDIEKYPMQVAGNGDVDIEIFTSGEKAGEGTKSWLITCAEEFNKGGYTTENGSSISISVRSVPSGTAADYIISGKYLPDLYTPSNTIFADYALVNGGDVSVATDRLVGNTAGFLIRKGSDYEDMDAIIEAVMNGEINVGYTVPNSSATGANLLLHILRTYGDGDISSSAAISAFQKFNNNIPYVAYTTQQMADSASNGTLDGMVSEYQEYINNENLVATYDFIPFGMRHDNPLYTVKKATKSVDELQAIDQIVAFLTNVECQELATEYGFNALDDYKDAYTVNGADITTALSIYKREKDNGKAVIAVFVADRSGSMDGEGITSLKESLGNGIKYINENNYVGLISYSNDITIDVPIAEFDMTQKAYFQGAVNRMQAIGATNTYEALCVAMDMIQNAKETMPDAKCMIFLLSDGQATGWYELNDITYALKQLKIPVYTIAYTSAADTNQLKDLSAINEATMIDADVDDIVYKIKSLFNAQL